MQVEISNHQQELGVMPAYLLATGFRSQSFNLTQGVAQGLLGEFRRKTRWEDVPPWPDPCQSNLILSVHHNAKLHNVINFDQTLFTRILFFFNTRHKKKRPTTTTILYIFCICLVDFGRPMVVPFQGWEQSSLSLQRVSPSKFLWPLPLSGSTLPSSLSAP